MSEKLTLIKYASEFFQNRKPSKILNIILPVILLLTVFSTGCKKDNFKGEVKGVCPLVSTDPMDKAVDVVLNKVISVTFNTAMNPATINNASFTIKQGAITVPGTIAPTANAAVFTFTPTAPLLPFTVYTGTITTAAKDTFRTSLINNYVWTFTTIPLITLSSNPVAGGITTGAGTFAQGSVVAVGAVPNAGYTFKNWTSNGSIVSTSASYQFTMAGNSVLVANFVAVPPGNFAVNLSSSPVAGGTTTGSGSHAAGSAVTVTATPNAGYAFINWKENGVIVSASSSYSFMLNANRTLVANFTSVTGSQFAVILSSNPTIGGTTAGSGLYNSGASVTVTANPNIGYTFINWTDNGAIASTSSSYTFPLNANRTLVANFSLIAGVGPGQIDLGTAGDFSILTKSGISTTGVTAVGGNIGVSPASSTAITGFGLIMDASGQFSHTPIVTGSVFAADYSAPTPAKMTTAVNDMQTAFTTANGLVTPAPIVGLYAGDISGRILPPGLYKWSTGVLISNAGVTLTGGPNDTWVFQISQDLTVNNGAIVTLLGGAQAKNIFWVVTGQATLGSNVDFSGNILSKTLISLNTGAKVTGKLLAQTAVTLNASTVVQP